MIEVTLGGSFLAWTIYREGPAAKHLREDEDLDATLRPYLTHGLGDAAARRRRARAILSHSARSAITGSILVARRAGNHDAHSVTSSRKTDSAR
jgi:hypothetical protein